MLMKPRLRFRDVIAIVHGAATLLVASGRIAREIRRWRAIRDRDQSRKAMMRRGTVRRMKTKKQSAKQTTVFLYRPVGQKELDRIAECGFTAFPPRLPEQPLFYPVLNEEYATQIARDWNTKDAFSGYIGYVLRFAVRADYLAHYAVHQVGTSTHREYWIPAEDLPAFNGAIVGKIEIVTTFYPSA